MLRAIRPALLAATFALAAWASTGLSAPGAHAGGGACHEVPATQEAEGDVVSLKHSCFSPTVLRVETGTKVTFRNDDPMVHYVTGVANSWGTGYEGSLAPGKTLTASFQAPGTYAYSCGLHPGMAGAVVVGDGSFVSSGRPSTSELVSARSSAANDTSSVAPQPQAATAGITKHDSDAQRLPYAALGAIGGAIAVAAAFAARQMRRS
jgi:plastocyanin